MSEDRSASPVRKDLTKAENNPWGPCESGCSDDVVADDCELETFSDDVHHCVDCREKCWDDRMLTCDCCGDWWCSDWQSAFVGLEECECKDSWKRRRAFAKQHKVANSELHYVCPTCAIKEGILCSHAACKTSVKGLLDADVALVTEHGHHSLHRRLRQALRTVK